VRDLSKKKMSAMQDGGASVALTLAACKNKEIVSREDLEVRSLLALLVQKYKY
jgi:hypothetical protein